MFSLTYLFVSGFRDLLVPKQENLDDFLSLGLSPDSVWPVRLSRSSNFFFWYWFLVTALITVCKNSFYFFKIIGGISYAEIFRPFNWHDYRTQFFSLFAVKTMGMSYDTFSYPPFFFLRLFKRFYLSGRLQEFRSYVFLFLSFIKQFFFSNPVVYLDNIVFSEHYLPFNIDFVKLSNRLYFFPIPLLGPWIQYALLTRLFAKIVRNRRANDFVDRSYRRFSFLELFSYLRREQSSFLRERVSQFIDFGVDNRVYLQYYQMKRSYILR